MQRLEAAQFFDLLDERAGLEGVRGETAGDSSIEELPPTPLGHGVVERTLARAGEPRPLPEVSYRRWWLRWGWAAVLLPTIAIIAFTQLQWSGRWSSTKLTYEEALEIVLDASHEQNYRQAALGRIASEIKRGISLFAEVLAESPSLVQSYRSALKRHLRKMVEDESLESRRSDHDRGEMAEILESLGSGNVLRISECANLLDRFVASCREGLVVVHRSRSAGGVLSKDAPVHLKHITRRIDRLK